MKRRLRKEEEAADVNVTPLLDIVFIMLIFFIVTATFVYEDGLDLNTPDKNKQDEQDSTPPPALLLSVREDGFVSVNDIRVIDPFSTKPVVEEFLAREPKGVIIVSAAGDSQTGVSVTVVDQAKQAGAGNRVSFTLQREKKG